MRLMVPALAGDLFPDTDRNPASSLELPPHDNRARDDRDNSGTKQLAAQARSRW
jgi:hypothetical protein